jgi:mannose/fructose/N-acetylgalactosamine-specific phosphotransferase system component IIB
MGLPPDIATEFLGVEAARARLREWRATGEVVILLTRNVATMRQLAHAGALAGEEVNIGGIHHAPGRREVLPYVYLSDGEAENLRALAREGAHISARDLPGARRVLLEQLLTGEARA